MCLARISPTPRHTCSSSVCVQIIPTAPSPSYIRFMLFFPVRRKGDSFSLYHSLALTRLALPDTILCGTTSALLLLCCFWYSAITAGSSISSSVMRRESARWAERAR